MPMKKLSKCKWHATMESCFDDDLKQYVFYWKVVHIEGDCGITRMG